MLLTIYCYYTENDAMSSRKLEEDVIERAEAAIRRCS